MLLKNQPSDRNPKIAQNVVAIAASQGGLNVLYQIISVLPADFPAAIVVVQHLSAKFRSYMVEIFKCKTTLQVKQAEEGDILRSGTIYTPVPDKHLLVTQQGTLTLSDAAKMNFVRPAANKLFASVAVNYKSRAIGVVLTGRDSDGMLGILEIKKYSGTVIAQDRATSECFSMPKSAIETGKVDFILPANAIADCLINLLMTEKAA